jgi:hypothetical protein
MRIYIITSIDKTSQKEFVEDFFLGQEVFTSKDEAEGYSVDAYKRYNGTRRILLHEFDTEVP